MTLEHMVYLAVGVVCASIFWRQRSTSDFSPLVGILITLLIMYVWPIILLVLAGHLISEMMFGDD